MQSVICLDRACHRIAESQIGLLRNSRETYTRASSLRHNS